jgi:hypothetical protein
MKKIEDSPAIDFAINKWKPMTYEAMIVALHAQNIDDCDEHGHDAVHTTSFQLDRTTTAAVYYRIKGSVDNRRERTGVWTPAFMTMLDRRHPNPKVIAFQYIDKAYDPHAPLEIDPDAT